MKLTLFLFLLSLSSYAQRADTTFQKNGFLIEFDSVNVVVDTLNRVSYVYDHHESKVKFSVNGSKPQPIPKDQHCLVVHYVNFTVTVSRKKYLKTYTI